MKLSVVMLIVTASLGQTFEAQFSQRNVPDPQRRNFHKWLRFYLDFMQKSLAAMSQFAVIDK
ncbi:MAG: hypothetical protein KGZ88_05460 [Methylomicrobium sp.]|nr:hypothetical protein [Methylomicrobium sp.]